MRNLKLPYQEGFFVYDVYAYNERAVREAVLNAVCHRNYQLPGSVFVKQYPDRIVFDSPGGFIGDITPENVLERVGRNRVLVSRQYYKAIGKGGVFTRLKGLDNDTNRELLRKHMVETGNVGVKLSEFKQVLPALGDRQIQWLLKSMVKCGVVYSQGKTKAARWYLNSHKGELTSG